LRRCSRVGYVFLPSFVRDSPSETHVLRSFSKHGPLWYCLFCRYGSPLLHRQTLIVHRLFFLCHSAVGISLLPLLFFLRYTTHYPEFRADRPDLDRVSPPIGSIVGADLRCGSSRLPQNLPSDHYTVSLASPSLPPLLVRFPPPFRDQPCTLPHFHVRVRPSFTDR